jgi:hypothetical protein
LRKEFSTSKNAAAALNDLCFFLRFVSFQKIIYQKSKAGVNDDEEARMNLKRCQRPRGRAKDTDDGTTFSAFQLYRNLD